MSFDFVKEEFNKLPIEEQVDYINKKLKFQSLTKISEQIKIDRATIRKRFKKNGYILNKEKSIYEKSNQTNKSNPLTLFVPHSIMLKYYIGHNATVYNPLEWL